MKPFLSQGTEPGARSLTLGHTKAHWERELPEPPSAQCDYLTSLECLLIFFSRHPFYYMSTFQPSQLKKKKKPHLASLNEAWEPSSANVKHSGAANASRGKTGKQEVRVIH